MTDTLPCLTAGWQRGKLIPSSWPCFFPPPSNLSVKWAAMLVNPAERVQYFNFYLNFNYGWSRNKFPFSWRESLMKLFVRFMNLCIILHQDMWDWKKLAADNDEVARSLLQTSFRKPVEHNSNTITRIRFHFLMSYEMELLPGLSFSIENTSLLPLTLSQPRWRMLFSPLCTILCICVSY